MAEIQDSTTKSKPRSRWLMGCFGFSRKVPKKNLKHSHDHMDIEMVKTGSLIKNSRWISWSKLGIKRSVAGKTVPVNTTVSDKFSKTHSFKLDKEVSNSINRRASTSVSPDQPINNKVHKKKRSMTAKNIILENREMDYSNSAAKDDTHQKPATSRKKEKKKTRSTSPGSPPIKKYVFNIPTTTLLPYSASFAMKHKAINGGDDDKTDGKFDPVIGMSIIMVTLVIMLLWGKLCAILCTSAWFYMVPRLRKVVDSNVIEKVGSDSGGLDLSSEQHKKKVVLEGLLHRNHRSVAGILKASVTTKHSTGVVVVPYFF